MSAHRSVQLCVNLVVHQRFVLFVLLKLLNLVEAREISLEVQTLVLFPFLSLPPSLSLLLSLSFLLRALSVFLPVPPSLLIYLPSFLLSTLPASVPSSLPPSLPPSLPSSLPPSRSLSLYKKISLCLCVVSRC